MVINGRVDRLVVSDTEVLIVDFKTDHFANDDALEKRAALYAAQGRVYQRALQGALGLEETPRIELWFLGVDRMVAF